MEEDGDVITGRLPIVPDFQHFLRRPATVSHLCSKPRATGEPDAQEIF